MKIDANVTQKNDVAITTLYLLFPIDAPTEAVKRKVEEESAETVDDGESVPEKKAKIAAAAEEANGDAVEEVAA